MNRRNLAFVILGCAKNQVEAESMSSRLAQNGWELTARVDEASVVVIHTCGFLDAARHEADDTVDAVRRAAPEAFVVMTGCYAQYLKEKRPPGVDAVLGTGDFHRLPEVIAEKIPVPGRMASPSGYHDATLPRPIRPGQMSAYLRVSEGCSHRCSFCLIPQLRGSLKSRPPEEIMMEAVNLCYRGLREISIISQETSGYGQDLHPRTALTDLIRELVTVDGLTWLRLMYAHPANVDDELIGLLATEKKLCGYLDMPLQHLSDKILKNMKRELGEKETMSLLDKLRSRVPGLTLRTTFIVGFPGETEKDFRRLVDVVSSGMFDHVGVFKYSSEPRALSARLPGQVPSATAEERYRRLIDAQSRVMAAKAKALVGETIMVLVEKTAEGLWTARGKHQAPEVDGTVVLSSLPARAGFYSAVVTGRRQENLTARVLPETRKPSVRRTSAARETAGAV